MAFDSASVAVKNEKTGAVERVDLPMRASAGGYYANLMRMYHYLGIPLHPVRFLFVFAETLATASWPSETSSGRSTPSSCASSLGKGRGRWEEKDPKVDARSDGCYFVHASNLHQTPPPKPKSLSVARHILEILYLIVCQLWFTIVCFAIEPNKKMNRDGGESLADYLERTWVPRRYITHYLLPLMSSVSTCTHDEILAFPASDIVNYKRLSHGEQHYAVCGGVCQVQSRLVQGISQVRLGAKVQAVVPQTGEKKKGSLVRWHSMEASAGQVEEEHFDRVVLAVSPDVAGKIFKPLAKSLGAVPTVQVGSSVLMPADKDTAYAVVDDDLAGSAGCMHHSGDGSAAQTITLRTLFHDLQPRTEALHAMPSGVVVSTCPLDGNGDAGRTLKQAKFTRTFRTTNSRATVERIMGRSGHSQEKAGWVNGEDNVWIVGAWCWDGMVLLEGCVVSAMKVAQDFGVRIPWNEKGYQARKSVA